MTMSRHVGDRLISATYIVADEPYRPTDLCDPLAKPARKRSAGGLRSTPGVSARL